MKKMFVTIMCVVTVAIAMATVDSTLAPDTTGDGKVTIADAELIYAYILRTSDESVTLEQVDVNGDGIVNTLDVVEVYVRLNISMNPEYLGSSIYDYLRAQGTFSCFLKVIDDLNYDDVLKRTGSKTLFVADDAAFMAGIKDEWGITEYEQLSLAQKRIILYNAMLDNAYLLEMLSQMQSVGADGESVSGQCLRRETAASVLDSIGLFPYEALPTNNPDWDIFKGTCARLALDATPTLMLHLNQDFLRQKNIIESDLQMIMRNPAASWNDVYIYDKKVIKEKSDVICKNGYVHQLEGLLIPPSNMAEELRQNAVYALSEDGSFDMEALDSTTLIFSRMLDRFSIPVPIEINSDVAETYYSLYPDRIGEQLYEKQYYVEGELTSYEDILGFKHTAVGSLLFNPGWNAYNCSGMAKECDMAAIFAPSDAAFVKYFTNGIGRDLLERYAFDISDNNDINKGLLQAIDRIPLEVLENLVRNHMQRSFVYSVSSKFDNIVNDARDPMGVIEDDLVKPILANNGVVYVMKQVYSPARFASVIAPVMLNDSLFVFNQMIESEGYDSYLLSMQNKFSLIVTADGSMNYFDPYTETRRGDRTIYKFMRVDVKDEQTGVINSEVKAKAITQKYNTSTNSYGELKDEPREYVSGSFSHIFKEILEYNIVIGDMNSERDCYEKRKYYMSKGYGSVKVERDAEGKIVKIAGGRDLQNGVMIPFACEPSEMENGHTFQLAGSLMQPPTQSVYDVLTDTTFTNRCFNRFYYDLCAPNVSVLEYLFGSEVENEKEWNKYRVFSNDDNKLVRMFDTYHYTVYVPTEQALEKAYSQGLRTWEELAEECKEIKELAKDDPTRVERTAQLKADADLIAKFVRYHFQDNSVFVDNPRHALTYDIGGGEVYENFTVRYATSALNESTNRFCMVVVQTDVEKNTIAVRGDFGEYDDMPLYDYKNVCNVVNTDPNQENKTYNVMTRDILFSNGTVSTSSYAVIHLIDNFLVYGGEGGIYDADNEKFIKNIE